MYNKCNKISQVSLCVNIPVQIQIFPRSPTISNPPPTPPPPPNFGYNYIKPLWKSSSTQVSDVTVLLSNLEQYFLNYNQVFLFTVWFFKSEVSCIINNTTKLYLCNFFYWFLLLYLSTWHLKQNKKSSISILKDELICHTHFKCVSTNIWIYSVSKGQWYKKTQPRPCVCFLLIWFQYML